jgi:ubiquinone/menaquinone biosynthesis C-methylase UbiE
VLLIKRHGNGSHSHAQRTGGLLLDRGWRYDLEVWFFDTFVMHGEISRLRQKVLEATGFSADLRLLDVGCGTGTLAIQAARRFHGPGQVTAVDPAPRQIARARSKARRAGLDVDFQPGVIEDLPFPDTTFDTVTSTLMMHHLPEDLKRQGLAEIVRVLRPKGRLVVADFDYPDGHLGTTEPAKNGYGGTDALPSLLQDAGFTDINTERITFTRQHRGWSGASLISAAKP